MRELARAAMALEDRPLLARLLDDLEPLVGAWCVNGAVVAFAGSHAHTAGLVAASLGRQEAARRLLGEAGAAYRRIGAAGWLAEVRAPQAQRERKRPDRPSAPVRQVAGRRPAG